ncbi:integumentary mucin C.1-like [Sycon ciliatum]|uniref:integumentary mucin C.1-like n=1 Tax=Sycon ciliatum TaxID=27933 RepID=UPI0031F6390B
MRTYSLVRRLCILVTSVALACAWGSHAKTISGNATLGSIPSLDVAKCSGIEPYADMGILIVGSTGMTYLFNTTQLFRTYTLTITDSWTAATSLTLMCRIPRLLSPGQHPDACIAPTVSSCRIPQHFGPTLNCKYSEVAVTVQKKDLGHSICFVVKEASSFDDPVKKICIRLVDGTPVVQTTPSPTPSPSPTAPPTTTPTIVTIPPTTTPRIDTTQPTTTEPTTAASIASTEQITTQLTTTPLTTILNTITSIIVTTPSTTILSISTTEPVTTAVRKGEKHDPYGSAEQADAVSSSSEFQYKFYFRLSTLVLALAIILTLACQTRRQPQPTGLPCHEYVEMQ